MPPKIQIKKEMRLFLYDTLFIMSAFVSKNNYYLCGAKKED